MAGGWLWIGVVGMLVGCVEFALRFGFIDYSLECCGCCIRFARVFLVLWCCCYFVVFCGCALWISLVACVWLIGVGAGVLGISLDAGLCWFGCLCCFTVFCSCGVVGCSLFGSVFVCL